MAKRKTTSTRERDALLEGIARNVLRMETLETRKSDSLDFHELAVWTIRQALVMAYDSGFDNAMDQANR